MSVFRILVNKGAWSCISRKKIFNSTQSLSVFDKKKFSSKVLVSASSLVRRDYSNQNVQKTDDTEVIYSGFLTKKILRLKVLSLTTSAIGIGIQPAVYTKAIADGTANSLTLPAFAFIGVLAIVTPLLLNFVTKRYIISVEYKPKQDKYVATYYNFFAMKKQIEFTPEDVTIPTMLGMFTSCAIKRKPVFLDAKFFTDQSHYQRIMGYDKPVDLLVDDEKLKYQKSK